MKKIIIMLIIDILFIALYVGGYYIVKYRIPREMNAEGTVVSDNNKINFKFNNVFSSKVIKSENEYKSKNVSIKIDKHEDIIRNKEVVYYVVDFYLSNVEYLKSGFAHDTYGIGSLDSVENMSKQFNAILAINGDYYSHIDNGIVIRNGVVYRKTKSAQDVCILYYDGTMKTIAGSELDIDKEINNGVYQAWSFGPELLNNGKSTKVFRTGSDKFKNYNPRTSIGYYEPGHYCFVLVDGRSEDSAGVKLEDLSKIYEDLGCKYAYNFDGGNSTILVYNDKVINVPRKGGRDVSDCVYIVEQ